MLNFNIINIDKPISYVIMARTPLYMKFDTRYCYAYVNSLCWGVDGCVCIYVCMIQAGGGICKAPNSCATSTTYSNISMGLPARSSKVVLSSNQGY